MVFESTLIAKNKVMTKGIKAKNIFQTRKINDVSFVKKTLIEISKMPKSVEIANTQKIGILLHLWRKCKMEEIIYYILKI